MKRAIALALWIVAGLTGSADARGPALLKVRFPPRTVQPGSRVERCLFVTIPRGSPFDLASVELVASAGDPRVALLHFLVYAYTGERLAEAAADRGRVVESRGCLEVGPSDRDLRQLVATGASRRSRRPLPPGVALRLAPAPASPGGPPAGLGILLDLEWANGAPRARRVSGLVVLRRARPGTVHRIATPIFDRGAELGLSVAPGTVASTEPGGPAVWRPAGSAGACVLFLTGHLHARGRFFAIDRLGADGLADNPPDGAQNPFEAGRRHLFGAVDFTDPGTASYTPPLLLAPGDALHYACWDDNGVTRSLRLGCEETPGVAPGRPAGVPGGGPAKPCAQPGPAAVDCPATDPAWPGRAFTGACVAANLVAGDTPDDEVCALAGVAFDPVPDVAPDRACDATVAPAMATRAADR